MLWVEEDDYAVVYGLCGVVYSHWCVQVVMVCMYRMRGRVHTVICCSDLDKDGQSAWSRL